MLENGANAMDWLKDPDVGPILLQISRIYTAEKSAFSLDLAMVNGISP